MHDVKRVFLIFHERNIINKLINLTLFSGTLNIYSLSILLRINAINID